MNVIKLFSVREDLLYYLQWTSWFARESFSPPHLRHPRHPRHPRYPWHFWSLQVISGQFLARLVIFGTFCFFIGTS